MIYEKYFKDMVESSPGCRKIVLIIFQIQNDKHLLEECGFLKTDINRLSKKYKNTLMELYEEYIDHNKNQEDLVIERFLGK